MYNKNAWRSPNILYLFPCSYFIFKTFQTHNSASLMPQNRVILPIEIFHRILDTYLLNIIDLHEQIENSDFSSPVFERQSNQTSEEVENLSQSDDESYMYYEEDEEFPYSDFYEDRSEDAYDESKPPKLHLFALFLTSKSTYHYILRNLLLFEVRVVRALLEIHLNPHHRILFVLPDSVFPDDKHAGGIEFAHQNAILYLVNITQRFTNIPKGSIIFHDIDLANGLGAMTAQHLVRMVAKSASRRQYYSLIAHEWGSPRWIEGALEKAPSWTRKKDNIEWIFCWELQESNNANFIFEK